MLLNAQSDLVSQLATNATEMETTKRGPLY